MKKIIKNIVGQGVQIVVCMGVLLLTGCFKKVSNDTVFIIKPNLQSESGSEMTVAEGVTAYAWFDRTEDWSFASYEDAVAGILTDTETGKTETAAPDAESTTADEPGSEGLLRLETRSASVLLLLLYPEEEMYAWRVYATGENLSPTYLTVQFRTWRTAGYTDSGWTVDMTPRNPQTPDEDEEEEEDENDEEDNDDDEEDNGDDNGDEPDDEPEDNGDEPEDEPDDNGDDKNDKKDE